MNSNQQLAINISGAGPAGLAAAVVTAEQNRQAVIYEKHDDVGHRFHGDFQGLENWTTEQDVLEEFASLGIKTNFDHLPIDQLTVYGPGGTQRTVNSQQPLLYLIRRGPQPGSLDDALKQQVQQCGAEIRFSQTIDAMPNGGIVTHGPHRADVIAVGYLFETDMADGLYMTVMDGLAPKGYAYLAVWNGRATIATCMFDDFHQEKQYLERTVEFFTDKAGLKMQSPRQFGGTGNYQIPETAHKGNILYAGESAGFQDPLFGFGIRSSILTGVAAAQALVRNDPGSYETFWKTRIRDIQRTGMVNRWFYERLGNNGYTRLIRNFPKDGDIRQRMFNEYRPKLWKSLWYQLIKRKKKRLFCVTPGCECTWCRCARCVPEGSLT